MRAYLRPMTWGLLLVLTLAWSGPTLLAQEAGTRPTPSIACAGADCQAIQEQARHIAAPLDMRPFAPTAMAAVTTPALAARAARAGAEASEVEADTATEPAQTAPPRAIERYVASLPIGSRVRVRLISGGSFNAVLMGVEQRDVIVRPRTRRAQIERRIPLAQIDFVELQPSGASRTGRVIATAAAVSAASFVTMILLLRAIYND